jgi:hypothetical protein
MLPSPALYRYRRLFKINAMTEVFSHSVFECTQEEPLSQALGISRSGIRKRFLEAVCELNNEKDVTSI